MANIDRDIKLLIGSIDKAVKEIFRKSGIDPSYSNRITVDFKNDIVAVYVTEGMKYVDSGRAKGSRIQPVSTIIRWIERKGISVPNGMTKKSVAYAIARSISVNGIKPRPFIERLNSMIEKLIIDYISNQIDKQLKSI